MQTNFIVQHHIFRLDIFLLLRVLRRQTMAILAVSVLARDPFKRVSETENKFYIRIHISHYSEVFNIWDFYLHNIFNTWFFSRIFPSQ